MGFFTSGWTEQVSFFIDGRAYSSVIDMHTYFGVFTQVQIIVWDELDPTLYSDNFGYNTLKRGYGAFYQAYANARDYVKAALQ